MGLQHQNLKGSGRVVVLGFKTQWKLNQPAGITITYLVRQDPNQILRDSSRSSPDPLRSGEIMTDPAKYWPNPNGSD